MKRTTGLENCTNLEIITLMNTTQRDCVARDCKLELRRRGAKFIYNAYEERWVETW